MLTYLQARHTLDAQLARYAQERAHVAARLMELPNAIKVLQTRMTDSLLRPLEESLRLELAPLEESPRPLEES